MTDNPRSDRQTQASRLNGAKSRGPTSPKGKAKSARNSKTHGLTGKLDFSVEEEDEIEKLAAKLGACYQVNDPLQAMLIDRVIVATLRLNRARALITETLEDIADPGNPDRLYEKRLNNAVIMEIRNQMQKMYGGTSPSRSLAKAVAEEAGYIPQILRPNRSALSKLMQYAQRFRGERDRTLARLEAIQKQASGERNQGHVILRRAEAGSRWGSPRG